MKTAELFAGIGGFRIASDELGLETVWANDIEPKASRVYRDRFGGNVFVEGDIATLIEEIPDHELLTAGFPCQPFSSAGKKLGIEDPRGTLFENIVLALKRCQPEFFVLENVKRLLSMDKGKHFATILDSLTGLGYAVEWRLLNAVEFGLPQNRERVVIVGSRQYTASSSLCTYDDLTNIDAADQSLISCDGRWNSLENHGARFHNWGIALGGKFCHVQLSSFSSRESAVTLADVLEKDPPQQYFYTEDTLKRIEESQEVNRFFNGVEILYNQKGGARMGYSIFGISGVAPTLTCTTSRHYERYKIEDAYRRLTPVEYARIQGFPDDHCSSASPYDQYPLFGNAVPPPMVKWAIERLTTGKSVSLNEMAGQLELLSA